MAIVIASVAAGALTSYAQGFLPQYASSLANSPSGWTLVTAGLVFGSRLPARWAAPLGAVSFVLLVLGYTAAADVRGYHYEPLRYSVIGIVVGPFVGAAAAWLRANSLRAALATCLLAGIGLGDTVYGLTTIRETTSPVYWVAIGAVSVVLVIAMFARRIRGALPSAIALAGTPLVAGAFVIASNIV